MSNPPARRMVPRLIPLRIDSYLIIRCTWSSVRPLPSFLRVLYARDALISTMLKRAMAHAHTKASTETAFVCMIYPARPGRKPQEKANQLSEWNLPRNHFVFYIHDSSEVSSAQQYLLGQSAYTTAYTVVFAAAFVSMDL